MSDAVLQVSLAIPDDSRFDDILKSATAIGFVPAGTFRMLGVATGTVPAAALERLRALPGIEAVEEQTRFRTA